MRRGRVEGLLRERAQEVLLALDAPEVGGADRTATRPSDERLVVTRAHVRERLRRRQVLAPGRVDVEAGLRVAGRRREVDRDRADRVDDLAETREVDLEVVADRDVEVVLDRLDHALRTRVERGVDLGAADARGSSTHRSRGNDTSSAVPVVGSTCATMIVSERCPVCSLRAAEVLGVGRVVDERARVGADEQEVAARLEHRRRRWSTFATLATLRALKEGHELIERGPYRFVRHPIYTGILAMLAGTAIALGYFGGFIGFLLVFVSFWVKLKREEDLMLEHFPAKYAAYQRRVKRIIPFLV